MFLAISGTYEEINGIQTYVATPKTDFPKDKAILYITDVYGLELNNNRVRRARPFPPPGHHTNHNPLSSFPTILLVTASRSMPQSFSKAIPSPKTPLILCVVPYQLYVHSQAVYFRDQVSISRSGSPITPLNIPGSVSAGSLMASRSRV
jgi:hypothetical protein